MSAMTSNWSPVHMIRFTAHPAGSRRSERRRRSPARLVAIAAELPAEGRAGERVGRRDHPRCRQVGQRRCHQCFCRGARMNMCRRLSCPCKRRRLPAAGPTAVSVHSRRGTFAVFIDRHGGRRRRRRRWRWRGRVVLAACRPTSQQHREPCATGPIETKTMHAAEHASHLLLSNVPIVAKNYGAEQ